MHSMLTIFNGAGIIDQGGADLDIKDCPTAQDCPGQPQHAIGQAPTIVMVALRAATGLTLMSGLPA